jgi:hypothetical protein
MLSYLELILLVYFFERLKNQRKRTRNISGATLLKNNLNGFLLKPFHSQFY